MIGKDGMVKMAQIEKVKDFWERNLCLDRFLTAPYLSGEYLEEGRKLRYRYHYHIPREIRRLSERKPGGRVLEIGLGMGIDTQLLCDKGFVVTGIDLTEKSVEATNERLAHYGLSAQIMTGNAEALGFEEGSFDAVYSFGVLHHTPDTEKAISEVHRVLTPGGIALIMLYYRYSLNYLAHKVTNTSFDGTDDDPCPEEKAYSKKEVARMFSGFSSVAMKVDYLFGTGWGKVNAFVPMAVKKILGRIIGWHLMIWAVK
jgi:ubiquinone/menaquinone biosynthesis C-methylase UbiE